MADRATSYRYYPLHQDVICDETAIDELPPTVDDLGCGRVMITCGPTILQACNTVPRVQEALGHRYVGTHCWSGSPSFPACGSHSDHPGSRKAPR